MMHTIEFLFIHVLLISLMSIHPLVANMVRLEKNGQVIVVFRQQI